MRASHDLGLVVDAMIILTEDTIVQIRRDRADNVATALPRAAPAGRPNDFIDYLVHKEKPTFMAPPSDADAAPLVVPQKCRRLGQTWPS